MAQDLTLNVKTTSDVPQAMEKAKSATTSFSKQIEDIQKKYSNTFKDVFLSYAAPLVLLNKGLDLILKYWEDQKRLEAEATQQAIDGINSRMSQEDIYWARKRAAAQKDYEDSDKNKAQIEKRTREFIMEDKRGYDILNEADKARIKGGGFGVMSDIAANADYQEAVRKIIMADLAKTGMIAKPSEQKPTDFKTPEGFSNVVGVGSNPVMEAMNAQLEETKRTNTLLEGISNAGSGANWMTGTPSRASLLMGR